MVQQSGHTDDFCLLISIPSDDLMDTETSLRYSDTFTSKKEQGTPVINITCLNLSHSSYRRFF